MLTHLNALIVACSRSWWKFLLVAAVQILTLMQLQTITGEFPAVAGGAQPFDMQNSLTSAQVFAQLEGYTPEAFGLYLRFQLIDFVFPIAAALMLASACGFFLRQINTAWFETIVSKKLLLLLLIPAVFDYLENINLLWVVNSWPVPAELAASLAVLAKMGKLSSMVAVFLLTAALMLVACVSWIRRRFGGSSAA